MMVMMVMMVMVDMMEMMVTVEQSSRQISAARATRHMSNIASGVASPYSRNLNIVFVIKKSLKLSKSFSSFLFLLFPNRSNHKQQPGSCLLYFPRCLCLLGMLVSTKKSLLYQVIIKIYSPRACSLGENRNITEKRELHLIL